MGGIDEAALDRLSLVTQMTKHIRVRASGGRTSASEIGQFSPIFVWLLRVICFESIMVFLMLHIVYKGFDNIEVMLHIWKCTLNNFPFNVTY